MTSILQGALTNLYRYVTYMMEFKSKKSISSKNLVVYAGLIAIIIGIVVHPILTRLYQRWPSIKNAPAFIQECKALLGSVEIGNVPRTQWPQYLKTLNPVGISVDPNSHVEVVLSNGGIGHARSYIFFWDKNKAESYTDGERKVTTTEYKCIYKSK